MAAGNGPPAPARHTVPPMRLGVLDVGSNTVHLLVVDARPGARPDPVRSHKAELRLAELLRDDGSLGPGGTSVLVEAVRTARDAARDEGVEELLAFATSAVRDATDSAQVLDTVRREADTVLTVLSGDAEARLTFLAVRRWFGWSAGRLLCLDIGGGSLELACGGAEDPETALSLPLGAGRVTQALPGDPPDPRDVQRLRERAREQLREVRGALLDGGEPDVAVATSKTFRSLARLDGAAPYRAGPYVPRRLRRSSLAGIIEDLAGRTAAERATLPGVSASRARQLLGGAVVAEAALEVLGRDEVRICPWALREGVVLHRLDGLERGVTGTHRL